MQSIKINIVQVSNYAFFLIFFSFRKFISSKTTFTAKELIFLREPVFQIFHNFLHSKQKEEKNIYIDTCITPTDLVTAQK